MKFTLHIAVLATLLLLVVSSCNLQKKRAEKCQKWGVCASTDSVIIKDTVKIDTIVLDDSQVWMDMLFECDSAGDILVRHIENLETENADLQMKLDNGHLVVYVKQPNDTITVLKPMHSETTIKTQTIYTNVLKWWQRVLMWCGGILLPLFLIYLWFKLKEFFTFLNYRQ